MRCGNCTGQHETADEVRACYGKGEVGAEEAMHNRFIESGLHKVDEGKQPQWPASDKQVDYIMGLQKSQILPEWWTPLTDAQARSLEKDEASGVIQMLKGFQQNKAEDSSKADYRNVPAGRYALEEETSLGKQWKFYEVQDGKGKWVGYKFIKRLVGAPGQYQKTPVARADRPALMRRLEADAQKAMTDYGLQSGVCGKCASPLTDPVSLARGIGPKCLAKLGW